MDDSTRDLEASPWLRRDLVASWREIITVLVLATGSFAAASAYAASRGSSSHYFNLLLTNSRMLDNLALESAVLGLLLLYLRRRGWTPADLRIKPDLQGTAIGVPLLLAMFVANTATVLTASVTAFLLQQRYANFLAYLAASSPHLAPHSVQIGWVLLVVAIIFNAFFEEITCTSYMFNQFAAKLGPFLAMLLTAMVRMTYHTYEGPIHMLGIGAVFVVAGACYWWTRNVWPLIVAHALIDLVSLAFLKIALG